MNRPPIGFRKYAAHALPEWFTMPHNGDQLKAIAKIAKAAMVGGMHAVAMEEGAGKTTLAMAAVLWVTFEGLRKYPLLLLPTADQVEDAQRSIERMKTLETHGRECPFFDDQVQEIYAEFANRARPAPGVARAGAPAGGVLRVQKPDLLVIDDAQDCHLTVDQLDEILTKTILTMGGPGKPPATILLGSPALVARIAGKAGWQAD